MRKLITLLLIGNICISAIIGQDLNLSVPGTTYKIVNDTIYIEKKSGESINFSVVYQLTGTNQPITVDVSEGPQSTVFANTISSGAVPKQSGFVTGGNYTDNITFVLPAGTTYAKYDYVDLVFKWPDLIKLCDDKQKRLTIKIHQRNKIFDWVKDASNTPKLEIIQYTDFLGINSDRPNGVFQEQLLFKWPIIKSYWNISKNLKIQPFRSVLIPNILLNRIDKAKDDSSILVPLGVSIVPSPTGGNDTIANVVGSFDLIRYANTIIESSVNLLTIHLDKTRLYLQYDFGLLRNRILDTISQDKSVSRPIYSYLTGWHVYIKSILDPKSELNIEAEFGSRKVNLQDNFFKQYDIYALENGDVKNIRFPVRTRDDKKISKPIYYASVKLTKDWGKESTNYVFFRVRYQWQKGIYRFVYKDSPRTFQEEGFSNHFFQVNLGISLGLEDLFKKQ